MARRPDFTPKTRAQIAYYMQLKRRFRKADVDPPEPPDPDEVFFITSEGQPFLTAAGEPLKPEAA